MAEDRGRGLSEKIEELDKDIEKIDQKEEERSERNIGLDEELSVKSRLSEREIIEEEKKDKKKEDDKFIPHVQVSAKGPSIISGASNPTPSVQGATGRKLRQPKAYFSAVSIDGLIKEVFARHWAAKARAKDRIHGPSMESTFRQMWAAKQLDDVKRERMVNDLQVIESRTTVRRRSINELHKENLRGELSAEDSIELKRLQQEEVTRLWMRQNVISNMRLHDQEKLNWLRPVGEGAYGVMPYAYLTNYDRLSQEDKKRSRWAYDNVLLRWQSTLFGRFIPKVSQSTWFKKKIGKDAENLFDDMDEEIYSEKEFAKKVKENNAKLEDMEEELAGYDRFTVAEEKEIESIVAKGLKEQSAIEKEQEMYS